MVFKTDKNFVTKVAIRGFTPPQLLRQFCRWQNRFYGLKRKLNGLIGKRYDKRKILTILLISTIRCVKIIVYTKMLCEI